MIHNLRFYVTILIASIALVGGSARLLAADADADDLTELRTVRPIAWQPIISHFYVNDAVFDATAPLPQADLNTLLAGWRKIESLAQIRPEGPSADALHLTGWRRSVEKEGGFTISGSQGNPRQFRKVRDVNLAVGFDVLMTTDPATRQALLSKYFQVTRWNMTAHFVGNEGDKDLWTKGADRKPSMADQLPGDMLSNGSRDLGNPDFAKQFRAWSKKLEMTPGLWEFRCEMAMRGKCAESESSGQDKVVQGAVRVFLYDGPIRASSFEQEPWQPIKP